MEGWLGVVHPQKSNAVTKHYFIPVFMQVFYMGSQVGVNKPVRLTHRISMVVTG